MGSVGECDDCPIYRTSLFAQRPNERLIAGIRVKVIPRAHVAIDIESRDRFEILFLSSALTQAN